MKTIVQISENCQFNSQIDDCPSNEVVYSTKSELPKTIKDIVQSGDNINEWTVLADNDFTCYFNTLKSNYNNANT